MSSSARALPLERRGDATAHERSPARRSAVTPSFNDARGIQKDVTPAASLASGGFSGGGNEAVLRRVCCREQCIERGRSCVRASPAAHPLGSASLGAGRAVPRTFGGSAGRDGGREALRVCGPCAWLETESAGLRI